MLIQRIVATSLTLDITSDLTYGRTFDLVDKHELRRLASAIRDSDYQRTLQSALPWLYNIQSSWATCVTSWPFGNFWGKPKRLSELLARYPKEREALPGSLEERSDIVSTLLAAHDSKTGYKLSVSEVWDAVGSMMMAGKLAVPPFRDLF